MDTHVSLSLSLFIFLFHFLFLSSLFLSCRCSLSLSFSPSPSLTFLSTKHKTLNTQKNSHETNEGEEKNHTPVMVANASRNGQEHLSLHEAHRG